jgi:hypothetical protein
MNSWSHVHEAIMAASRDVCTACTMVLHGKQKFLSVMCHVPPIFSFHVYSVVTPRTVMCRTMRVRLRKHEPEVNNPILCSVSSMRNSFKHTHSKRTYTSSVCDVTTLQTVCSCTHRSLLSPYHSQLHIAWRCNKQTEFQMTIY